MLVYKYMDQVGVEKTLEGMKLIVRPVNAYNDPFESLPIMDDGAIEKILVLKLQEVGFLDKLRGDPKIFPDTLSLSILKERLENDETERNRVVDALAERFRVEPFDLGVTFQTYISRQFGIVSFSRTSTNPLLWSHYADQHKGYVIAFETGIHWDKVWRVNYSQERVQFQGGIEDDQAYIEALTTKFMPWAYEEEVRLICQENYWINSDHGYYGFLEFSKEQVCWIASGIRTADENRRRIERLITKKHLDPLPFFKAKVSPNAYSIDFEAL